VAESAAGRYISSGAGSRSQNAHHGTSHPVSQGESSPRWTTIPATACSLNLHQPAQTWSRPKPMFSENCSRLGRRLRLLRLRGAAKETRHEGSFDFPILTSSVPVLWWLSLPPLVRR